MSHSPHSKNTSEESGQDTFHSETSFMESEDMHIPRTGQRQSQIGAFLSRANSTNSKLTQMKSGRRASIFKTAHALSDFRDNTDPFGKQESELDQLIDIKRFKRHAVTNKHFLDAGLLSAEGESICAATLKKKILTRALPSLKTEKAEQEQAISQEPMNPKAKMDKIYDKYFTKIIFNKKKSSGIENKLKVFDHLSSYVKSKSYLQNINKIYNMGQQAEQKVTLGSQIQQLKELRDNTTTFYKHFLMKNEEEDWHDEKALDGENARVTQFLRTGIKPSILDKISSMKKSNRVKREQAQQSTQPLLHKVTIPTLPRCSSLLDTQHFEELGNHKPNHQKFSMLVDYNIHTRQDAQRVYNAILHKEREDIQKLKYNIQQHNTSKEKYERIMFKEKILKLYNEMKDDRKVRSIGGFAEVEQQALRIQAYYAAKAKARQARKKAKNNQKLTESMANFNSPETQLHLQDKALTTGFMTELEESSKQILIKNKKESRLETQQKIQQQVKSILSLQGADHPIHDLERLSPEDIILKNQERILENSRSKSILKDEQIMRLVNQLLENSKQIFQVGFNKFLVQENKRQLDKEKRQLRWDTLYDKLSKKVINNTLQASRHIYREIIEEKEEDIQLHNAILNNLHNQKMSQEDQEALKQYVIEKLQKNNVDIIHNAAAQQDLNNLARDLEM